MSAKAETVGHGAVDFHLACFEGDIIQITLRVGGFKVNRGRRDIVPECEACSDEFNASACAE